MNINESILLELFYLPPIQYFCKMVLSPTVIIEQCEHYQKGSYRNRCNIAGPNGVHRLTIPLVKGKNQQQPIRDVKISYEKSWKMQHWNSIQTAYGKAPYFDYYADQFRSCFQRSPKFLFDWNWQLLEKTLPLLPLECKIRFSEKYETQACGNILDYRNVVSPKPNRQIPDPQFEPAIYGQVFIEKHGFLPNLSILDLLFCMGPEAVIYLEKSIVS